MRTCFIAGLSSMAGLIASSVACGETGPDFKEGEWEIEYSMEVTGMPFHIPPITGKRSSCLSKSNFVPDNSQPGQTCETRDVKVEGNAVRWTMQCKTPEGSVEGHGRVIYHGDRYEGGMKAQLVTTANPNMPIDYQYTMRGVRHGACR